MHKHSIIIDGETFTRNSKRQYTHVVVVNEGTGNGGIFSWHSSKRLADKKRHEVAHGKWDYTADQVSVRALDDNGYADFVAGLKPGQSLTRDEYDAMSAGIISSQKA